MAGCPLSISITASYPTQWLCPRLQYVLAIIFWLELFVVLPLTRREKAREALTQQVNAKFDEKGGLD